MIKAAYQGIRGAYSEMAVFRHFGDNISAVGCETFEEVFQKVKDGVVPYGVIPIENTIGGSIAANYDLLLREKVSVIAEIFVPIRHVFLSKKGNSLKNIREAYSHPQALAQCRQFLLDHGIRPMPEYDTAGAAKIVAEREKEDEAAIASSPCAGIYGLEIIREDIQKSRDNITRFFVIAKKKCASRELKAGKTSIAFKTKHYPGALVDCLARFSKNKVNLTKLESRPVPEHPWEYVFYADFEGKPEDKNVNKALRGLEKHALFVKILGSYERGN